MNEKVFISYSRKDSVVVEKIVETINTELGIECWIDRNGIESSDQFVSVIIAAIQRADVVLFMLSEDSMNSFYAKKEVAFAFNKGKKLVPICLGSARPVGEFEFYFSDVNYVCSDDSRQMAKLLKDMSNWLDIRPIGPVLEEIKSLKKEWYQYNAQADSVLKQIKQKEASIGNRNTDASREIEALLKGNDEEVKKLKQQIQEKQAAIDSINSKFEQSSNECNEFISKNRDLQNRLDTSQKKIETLERELENLRKNKVQQSAAPQRGNVQNHNTSTSVPQSKSFLETIYGISSTEEQVQSESDRSKTKSIFVQQCCSEITSVHQRVRIDVMKNGSNVETVSSIRPDNVIDEVNRLCSKYNGQKVRLVGYVKTSSFGKSKYVAEYAL